MNDIMSNYDILALFEKFPSHFVHKMKKNNLNTYNYIMSNYSHSPRGNKKSELVYQHVHGKKQCVICGSDDVEYRSFKDGHKKHCSRKCMYADKTRMESAKKTLEVKYGDPHYNNRTKCKQTYLERYGAEHNWASGSSVRHKQYDTCLEKHGNRNYNNIEKNKKTLMERYGVEHQSHLPDFLEKSKKTCLGRYGKEYYSQTDEFKEVCIDTSLKKYGVPYPMQSIDVINKMRYTNMLRYGCDSYSKTDEFKDRYEMTSIDRYGVRHPMQNPVIADKQTKSAYKYKKYKLPSGKEINIQGYENFSMDLMIKEHSEEDIITDRNDVPEIWYLHDNKKRRYYPDLFIKSLNLVVEVKSDYTVDLNPFVDELKKKATLNAGYNFLKQVFNSKGKLAYEEKENIITV